MRFYIIQHRALDLFYYYINKEIQTRNKNIKNPSQIAAGIRIFDGMGANNKANCFGVTACFPFLLAENITLSTLPIFHWLSWLTNEFKFT